MGKKQDVINKVYTTCKEKNIFTFNNELLGLICKEFEFGNQFDATKFDNTSILPELLIRDDYFILHLGEGRHQFVKGINNGYHKFEEIDERNEVIPWKYRKSLLNEFDTSESNILSVASNQRIIQDFIYDDIIAEPKVYNARRTKMDISYAVGIERINAENLQMEIDLTMELNGIIAIFEGKNGFPEDFAIYQIFHPFKYYSNLKNTNSLPVEKIVCCYILRKKDNDGNSVLRLYNYTFEDENRMDSIKLLKKAQYNLIKR